MKNKIIYQIYPLSFSDSNSDGVGDLQGIIEKLNYIKSLSVDLIWMSPIMKSPMIDNGYDVSSYCEINPIFGNIEDFKELVKEAKKINIGIVMDIVMNHTSNKHEWFEKSRNRISPYEEYYVWRDKPSGYFNSQFSNNAWTYDEVRGQYYLHHFAVEQPDLNWENPLIEKEFVSVLNYWLNLGVKGFRFDVVDMIGKEIDKGKTINLEKTYDFLKSLKKATWSNFEDIFTVGECWSTPRTIANEWISNKGVFSTIFNARYMFANWHDSRWDLQPVKGSEFVKMKKWIFETMEKLNLGSVANFIENHDFPRSVSRLFDKDGFYSEKAKLILTSFYGFSGPSFIFQEQELGAQNGLFKRNDFNDPETKKFLRNAKGFDDEILFRANTGTRDNARIFYKWDDKVHQEWLPNIRKGRHESFEQQISKKDSVLNFYKDFFAFKKLNDQFFGEAVFEPLDIEDKKIFAYRYKTRDKEIWFVSNWTREKVPFVIKGNLLFSSNYQENYLLEYGSIVIEIRHI